MNKHYVEKFRIREDGTMERKTIGRLKHGAWARSKCIEEFLSVYEFENREFSESKIRGPLYFDLDTNLSTRKQYKELKHQVRILYHCLAKWKIEKREIELYFSGAKGFHLLVPAELPRRISPRVLGRLCHGAPLRRLDEIMRDSSGWYSEVFRALWVVRFHTNSSCVALYELANHSSWCKYG